VKCLLGILVYSNIHAHPPSLVNVHPAPEKDEQTRKRHAFARP